MQVNVIAAKPESQRQPQQNTHQKKKLFSKKNLFCINANCGEVQQNDNFKFC